MTGEQWFGAYCALGVLALAAEVHTWRWDDDEMGHWSDYLFALSPVLILWPLFAPHTVLRWIDGKRHQPCHKVRYL